jgi:hypothetical protein
MRQIGFRHSARAKDTLDDVLTQAQRWKHGAPL